MVARRFIMPFSFSSIESQWQRFLMTVNTLATESGKPAPKVFISYAWESSNEATEPMQQRLALLQRDLLAHATTNKSPRKSGYNFFRAGGKLLILSYTSMLVGSVIIPVL